VNILIAIKYLLGAVWCLALAEFYLLLQKFFLFRGDKYKFFWSMERSRFFECRVDYWLSRGEEGEA
jgi:hypothetical protein